MIRNDCLFRAVPHAKTSCPERRLNLAYTMGSSDLPQAINALSQTRVNFRNVVLLTCIMLESSTVWIGTTFVEFLHESV